MKEKGKNPVPFKWVFKSKEEPGGSINMKFRNVVNGYMQVHGVEFKDSFPPVVSET